MRDKNKGGRFQWGGALTFPDFLFCCESVGTAHFPFFDARFWDFFSPCHWSCQLVLFVEDFLMNLLDERWDGEEREAEAEREKEAGSEGMRVWAPVVLRQYPGMPPLRPTKLRAEHSGCIQGDQDQTLPDGWYKLNTSCLGFLLPSRILFAALIVLPLVINDRPALHRWSEAIA